MHVVLVRVCQYGAVQLYGIPSFSALGIIEPRPKAVQEQCEKLRRLYGEAEFRKSILGANFATSGPKGR